MEVRYSDRTNFADDLDEQNYLAMQPGAYHFEPDHSMNAGMQQRSGYMLAGDETDDASSDSNYILSPDYERSVAATDSTIGEGEGGGNFVGNTYTFRKEYGGRAREQYESSPSFPNRKLFVGMLPKTASTEDLEALFAPFGSMSEVYLMREADGVTSRGSAFVIFDSADAAAQATLGLHNAVPPGFSKPIVVKRADDGDRGYRGAAGGRGSPYRSSRGSPLSLHYAPAGRVPGPGDRYNTHNLHPGYYGHHTTGMYIDPTQGPPHMVMVNAMGEQVYPVFHQMPMSMHPYGAGPPSPPYVSGGQGGSPRDPSTEPYYLPSPMFFIPSPPHSPTHSTPPSRRDSSTSGRTSRGTRTGSFSSQSHSSVGSIGNMEGPEGANLFIYHLPASVDDDSLCRLFSPYGEVLSAKVIVNKRTDESKGFGFVSYTTEAAAELAIGEMNGYQIQNKRLKVQLKIHKEGCIRAGDLF